MISEVKVFDGQGNLKKIISAQQSRKEFWKKLDITWNNPTGKNRTKTKTLFQAKPCSICQKIFRPTNKRGVACSEPCKKEIKRIYQKNRYEELKAGGYVSKRRPYSRK